MPLSRFTFRVLIAAFAVVAIALPGRAEAPTLEYQVKAAFIYNFMQFIEWPDDAFEGPDSPFVVGVFGADPFDGALEKTMAGKSVGKRQIEVKKFRSIEQIERCHVLFFPAAETERARAVIGGPRAGRGVLVLGETDGFVELGGTIEFLTEDNKLHFEINVEAVDKAGLKVSSKLLKLAHIYKK